MSRLVEVSGSAQKVLLERLYLPIAGELAQAEEILRAELRSKFPFVDELVRHSFRLGGKRLRPALVLLAAKATGTVCHDHLVLAAVMEMIHTATLVHDDVLDQANLRRHLDTINARWGNESSVLLGDYLFTHSFYLASTLGTTYACQTIGKATNIVCEGELRQIASRGDYDLSEQAYLDIIEAKTAELCSCCCRLGAHYAGAEAAVEESLARFGRYLGIAFQIVDDLLDMQGDEDTTGKSLGTDLEQRKPTLPLIRLLAQADATQRGKIVAALDADPCCPGALDPWFDASDALAYTRDKARWFADQARAELAQLPASDARAVLEVVAEFAIERQH
ncbi:MAG TPA: polyprenyl synthetase family protein [Pirellulales bacterium]|nr:polyprenyl synthetase family protein [Pirellulales bacterium]